MEKTLVVLAAGMGSRFGGLKQIEPVGPHGEFILDYSVYDAKRAGFTKVVFIIKEENYEIFKETVGKRIEDKIKVCYAFQSFSDVPDGTHILSGRLKPLGTAHALYCARDLVHEPFAVISADDFYGREPFYLLSDFLDKRNDYAVIGYHIGSTLSANGSVKRGVCFDIDGKLESIVESKVERVQKQIVATPLDGRPSFTLEENHPVSMLMYGLHPNIFLYLSLHLKDYFNHTRNPLEDEYLLPDVLDQMKHQGIIDIKIIKTTAKWMGITYQEDLKILKDYLNDLILKGEYPKNLWE